MPFAPQIRRHILQALEERVLPAWQSQVVTQVLAQPPFHLDHVPHWTSKRQYLREQDSVPSLVALHWPKGKVNAGRFPYFGFVYEGTLDHRIVLTQSLATQIKNDTGTKPPSTTTFRVSAPGFIYFAPGVPGVIGADPALTVGHAGNAKIIWASVMNDEVRLHYGHVTPEETFGSHSVQVHEPGVIQLLRIYAEESRLAPHNAYSHQSLLQIMATRIYRQLQQNNTALANSAWAVSGIHTVNSADPERDYELCRSAMDFIEIRLHENVKREEVARALGVSADYLGRVFQQTTGTTLMRYVTTRRIEAAKLVLAQGSENISEITQLVGFASPASFCGVFKRRTGLSPMDYRRLNRNIG